jgi:U3 small nucleolar ribonucleoprotein protein LCP5
MSDFAAAVNTVSDFLSSSKKHLIEQSSLQPENGMSILSAKYNILMQYCADLCLYMEEKIARERAIEPNLPFIERLVEGRIVLEKMRPIEQKLKFQVDRLLQTGDVSVASEATSVGVSAEHALLYKPNPNALAGVVQTKKSGKKNQQKGSADTDSSEVEAVLVVNDGQEEENDGLYRPPKLAPMYFEDKSTKGKTKKQEASSKKKAVEVVRINQLREEFSEKPLEFDERTMVHVSEEVSKNNPEKEDIDQLAFGRRVESGKKKKEKRPKFRTMADELEDLFSIGDAHGQPDEDDKELARLRKKLKLDNRKKGKKPHSRDSDDILSSEDDF